MGPVSCRSTSRQRAIGSAWIPQTMVAMLKTKRRIQIPEVWAARPDVGNASLRVGAPITRRSVWPANAPQNPARSVRDPASTKFPSARVGGQRRKAVTTIVDAGANLPPLSRPVGLALVLHWESSTWGLELLIGANLNASIFLSTQFAANLEMAPKANGVTAFE